MNPKIVAAVITASIVSGIALLIWWLKYRLKDQRTTSELDSEWDTGFFKKTSSPAAGTQQRTAISELQDKVAELEGKSNMFGAEKFQEKTQEAVQISKEEQPKG